MTYRAPFRPCAWAQVVQRPTAEAEAAEAAEAEAAEAAEAEAAEAAGSGPRLPVRAANAMPAIAPLVRTDMAGAPPR
jgi:hypothetical protein